MRRSGTNAALVGGAGSTVGTAPTRRVRRAGRVLLSLFLVLSMAGAITFGIVMRTGHLQLEPVLSGSMRPAAQPGDLIVAKQTATTALKVGDVVAFFPPGSTGTPVMHRIVSLTRDGDTTTITTKGDANSKPDPWGPVVLRSASTYRMVRVLPKIGFASVWFNRFTGNAGRGLLFIFAGILVLAMGALSLRRPRAPPVSGDAGAQSTTSVIVN